MSHHPKVGELVVVTGYGHTGPGIVEEVFDYPEHGATIYDVRTGRGVLPYEPDDITAAEVPEPGQWWETDDGVFRLRVDEVLGGGVSCRCTRDMGDGVLRSVGEVELVGHYRRVTS